MLLIVSASAATSPLALTVSFCVSSPWQRRFTTLTMPAHLFGKVGGHHVDVVGEVLPCAGHTGDLRLAAQLAFRTDFARHASHLRREGIQLVDIVLICSSIRNLTFYFHGDLARQVAAGDCRRHLSNVANLSGQVAGPLHSRNR